MFAPVQELVERVRRVDRVVLFRSIFAGVLQNDLRATRVLGEELGDIVGLSVDTARSVSVGLLLGRDCNTYMTQQSSRLLCFATSCPVSFLLWVLLLSWFILSFDYC